MDLKPPPSYQELRKSYKPLRNVSETHRESLATHERFALWINQEVGSTGFFILIVIWTVFWLLWNTHAPFELRFDPFPAFALWIFISNMIQLTLLPLILIGQNLEARHHEAQAKADYEINSKSEKEIELVLAHLEYQHNLIAEILKKLEK